MVLGWAEDAGLEVQRRMLTIDDVLDADEIFLTNSGFGVLPSSGSRPARSAPPSPARSPRP
jgi:branched-subunit amino acid aminotransferase/4-amino-4-deoxychorismate lyase